MRRAGSSSSRAAPEATDDEDFALRLVADLDPFDPSTHTKLGKRLLAKNDNAAALIEFQAALATQPGESRRRARRRRGGVSQARPQGRGQAAGARGAQARADVCARAGPAAGGVGTELMRHAHPRRRHPRDARRCWPCQPRLRRSNPRRGTRWSSKARRASDEFAAHAPPVARRHGRRCSRASSGSMRRT